MSKCAHEIYEPSGACWIIKSKLRQISLKHFLNATVKKNLNVISISSLITFIIKFKLVSKLLRSHFPPSYLFVSILASKCHFTLSSLISSFHGKTLRVLCKFVFIFPEIKIHSRKFISSFTFGVVWEATKIKIRIFHANKVLAAENLLCELKFMHWTSNFHEIIVVISEVFLSLRLKSRHFWVRFSCDIMGVKT